jgi:hypothetical protein
MRMRKRSATHELLNIVDTYRERTGVVDVDMNAVAIWAINTLGVSVKPPKTEAERLAENLSRAARTQTRRDATTNRPYRVNHAYPAVRGGESITLWTDIDAAPREPMMLSFQQRRNQMIADGYHLSLDNDHWNSINLHADPIRIQFDFTDDILERRAAADIEDESALNDPENEDDEDEDDF